MSSLWKSTIGAAPDLERWVGGSMTDLEVGRLPRPAWPIVAGAVARAWAPPCPQTVHNRPGDRGGQEAGSETRRQGRR